MAHEHEFDHCKHHKAHCCMKIAKLALKAAGVCAAFCIANEIHRVHKSIEKHK